MKIEVYKRSYRKEQESKDVTASHRVTRNNRKKKSNVTDLQRTQKLQLNSQRKSKKRHGEI